MNAKPDIAGDIRRPPLERQTWGDALPLSFGQQRLWFLEQLQPGYAAYNIVHTYRLQGRLNAAALEHAVREILRRHSVLRGRFDAVVGQPVQTLWPADAFELPLEDLGVAASTQPTAALEARLIIERQTPVDLRRAVVRATLLRLAPDDHALVITLHHIAADGWSLHILDEELAALYAAFAAGQPSPLPELPVQYADFAHWQTAWWQGPVREQQVAYWRRQLAGIPPLLELPLDRPRPQLQSFSGAQVPARLAPELVAALQALAQTHRTTLFMVLLAAYQILLHRISGQDDIVVGVPLAGRSFEEVGKLIGDFVNTVVLRTALEDRLPFPELLARIRETALDAYEHQDLPFEELVRELQPERNLAHTPLFQVMLNMFPVARPEVRLPGLRVEVLVPPSLDSKYDLTLYVEQATDGLQLLLVYNRDLMDAARMEELLAQYEALLRQIIARPQEPIGDYSLLTAGARRRLPNPVLALEEPAFETVPDTFLAGAVRYPDRPAIRQEAEICSYADLAARSERLAQALLRGRLRPGAVVALAGSRCIGWVVAVLGILRAGGVLLALDNALPLPRRRLMMQEARAAGLVLVGDPASAENPVADDARLFRLCLDCAGAAPETPEGPTAPLPRLAGDDPAYVFFTSGSTGTPKGVLGCHKGLAHFMAWQRATFAIGPEDRVAQLAGCGFDVVMRDLFLPLTSGAVLCLPPAAAEPAAPQTLRWLAQEGITLFHVVPGIVQNWLADVEPDLRLPCLRWAFLAGEALSEALVRRWRAAFPESGPIVNFYGPTETTLIKSYHVVDGEPLPGIQPIGWPLPQTQLLILNATGRLCGIGEPGEIVIRTPFRALGYVNAPEEQRLHYVPNPFRTDPRDILYRTGDRGRYRPDGSVAFLGRLDDQVKIRGVRVEPGEVTAVLGRDPRVAAGCVVARPDAQGEPMLVAYVVAAAAPLAAADLRATLAQQLPSVMVPATFVFLDALPLLPNGKVDRRALPAPTEAAPAAAVPPRTENERILADLWGHLLKRPAPGVNENFFELGGHSLLAMRLVAHIRQTLQVEIPLRKIFEYPTIEGLALCVLEQQARAAPGGLEALLDEVAPVGSDATR